jgi:hypothetical protein
VRFAAQPHRLELGCTAQRLGRNRWDSKNDTCLNIARVEEYRKKFHAAPGVRKGEAHSWPT